MSNYFKVSDMNPKLIGIILTSLFLLSSVIAVFPAQAVTTYTIWFYIGHGAITVTNLSTSTSETLNGTTYAGSPVSRSYNSGTQLSILATPDTDYAFDYWGFYGGSSGNFTNNPFTATILSSFTLLAYFELVNTENYVTFSLLENPSAGGTAIWFDITNPLPSGFLAAGTYTVAEGDSLGFSANAVTGYVFDHWSVNNVENSTTNPLVVNSVTENFTVTAYFLEVEIENTVTLYFDPALLDGSDGSTKTTFDLNRQTNYAISIYVTEPSNPMPSGNYYIQITSLSYSIDDPATLEWVLFDSGTFTGGYIPTHLVLGGNDLKTYMYYRVVLNYSDGPDYVSQNFIVAWADNLDVTPTPTGWTGSLTAALGIFWSDTAKLIYGVLTIITLTFVLGKYVKQPGVMVGLIISLVLNVIFFMWPVWSLFVLIIGVIYLLFAPKR